MSEGEILQDIPVITRKSNPDNQEWDIFHRFPAYLQLAIQWLFSNTPHEQEGFGAAESALKPDSNNSRYKKNECCDDLEMCLEKTSNTDAVSTVGSEILTSAMNITLALFRSPRPVTYKPSRTYDEIMAKLIRLEDNGDFDEFDRFSTSVVACYATADPDIVAAVTVEHAVCLMYRGEPKKAKRIAKKGYDLAGRTCCPAMFEARALLVMATLSRRKKKLGSAKKYLELAEQCLKTASNYEDLAHFHECYGTFLDAFIGHLPHAEQNVTEHALTSFKKMSEIAFQDSRQRVHDKNRFYALLRSTRILLDSNSSFGRQRRAVPASNIALASKYLEMIERDLLKSIPRGSQIQFRLVKSDLYFRQGKFGEEKKLLLKCRQEAKMYNFITEEPIIMQRIREIDQMEYNPVTAVELDAPENAYPTTEGISNKESGTESATESDVFTSKYE